MNKLFIITGASGSGKTTAAKNVEKTNPSNLTICYFDSIGVPSFDEMVAQYGSGEGWQKAITEVWIKKIVEEYLPKTDVILDGQIRLAFITEACQKFGLENYEMILFDCSDEERKNRLISRGHPELVNPNMMNWAKYLREETNRLSGRIIDNTNLTEDQSRDDLLKILGR